MRRLLIALTLALVACDRSRSAPKTDATSLPPLALASYRYPLRLAADGRGLVDGTDTPFLMVGDAPWSLLVQPTDAEVDRYLAARRDYGFNTLVVNLVEAFAAKNAPADIAGTPPFIGTPFVTPNEPYFARAERIIRRAGDHGMLVLLAPAYLGYDCGEQGWSAAIRASSPETMASWGRWVGTRFRDHPNIVWLVGGDADPRVCGVRERLAAMVEGIRAVDSTHLISAHNRRGQMAVDTWPSAEWLTLNNIYSDGLEYAYAATARDRAPRLPFFLIEGFYEGDSHAPSPVALRSQAYWTVLGGGFGAVYGACPMWLFGAPQHPEFCESSDWESQLASPGALGVRHFVRLFRSRHWHRLRPDTGVQVLPSGGTGSARAVAAIADDSSSIIAYLPEAREVRVRIDALAARVRGWWYDPASGRATAIDLPSGTEPWLTLSPPRSGDWVLVLDSEAFGFAPP